MRRRLLLLPLRRNAATLYRPVSQATHGPKKPAPLEHLALVSGHAYTRGTMKFPAPLVRGTLQKRYKRFLADVALPDGSVVVAHCANPGSMAGLAEPGSEVWLSPATNPKRKLQWTWELVADAVTGSLVGVNTGLANTVVAEALERQALGTALAARSIRREVRYGDRSRVDFLLEDPDGRSCFLEVKSVTLRRSAQAPHAAEFPDAVTARGARHLRDLAAVCDAGDRAVLLYLVQRMDCTVVRLAADIDPAYAAAAGHAQRSGVEFLATACTLSPDGIAVGGPLPVEIGQAT